MKKIVAFLVLLCVAGCVTPPSGPPPFTGPVAHFETTARYQTMNSENYVFVPAINGGDYYQNGTLATYRQLTKSGTVYAAFDIPAGKSVTVSLSAHTLFSAPIFCMADPDYAVSGDVTFTPVAGKTYIAKGSFSSDYSAVWIEDKDTAAVMGKISADGSAMIPISHKFLGGRDVCPLNHLDF
jgi:hypothetical protein